jgi:glycosyltransferase involved in cell wall biosynthesis
MTAAFDIVIPTWERRTLLLDTIASAVAQTVPARVCVVDNASTDGSAEAARTRFGARVEVHRFDEHVPYQRNLNRCVDLLRAEFGLVLHDDDLLDPGYVEHALRAFEAEPGAALVITGARPLQAAGSPFRRARIRPPFLWFRRAGLPVHDGRIVLAPGVLAEGLLRSFRMNPYWPTVSYRRAAIQERGFPSDLKTLLDYEAWVRISARHAVVLSERTLCSNRFHGSMMTNLLIWPHTRSFEEDVLVIASRLEDTLGHPPHEAVRVRVLSKVLYPTMLLGPGARRAQYERYLAHSGYPFERLVAEAEAELDEYWRFKGWRGPLARAGWQLQRLGVRATRRSGGGAAA